MSYWFHRNPLKATTQVNFDLKLIVTDSQAVQICSELRQSRNRLLDLLPDPNNAVSVLHSAFEKYLSLLQGLIIAPDAKGGESKLRYAIRFRWTQTVLGNVPLCQQDAIFEFISICQNVAIWYTKHAAMVAAKDEITVDEAKEVHKCLRIAAGIFKSMSDNYLGKLVERDVGSDLDINVVIAYVGQCTAEAQEVTIGRAVELKHATGLISALANETSKLYSTTAAYLNKLNPTKVAKWKKYCEFKNAFYQAYAYLYSGQTLLSQEQCGAAIRALKESEKYYAISGKLCKEYCDLKGPGTSAKPENNFFFHKLGVVLKRELERCERENGFIFHQKTPDEPVPLEMKATYGLASPEDFTVPAISPAWTPVAYAAFDSTKYNSNDPALSKSAIKTEGEIPPVKEASVHQSSQEPKTTSGCSLQ